MQNLLTGYCDRRQFVTQPPPLPPPLPTNNNLQTLFSPAAFIFSMSGLLASAPSIHSVPRSLPKGMKYKPWARRSAQRPPHLPHIQSSPSSPSAHYKCRYLMEKPSNKKTPTCHPKNSFPELKVWQSFAVLITPAQGRAIGWLEQEVFGNELLLGSARMVLSQSIMLIFTD